MTQDAEVSLQALDPEALIGLWRFDRVILNRMTGMRCSASGEITFSRQDENLIRWSERGTLDHHGTVLSFRRLYLLQRQGDRWEVRFEDGRFFHVWAPGRLVSHPCGPDLYRGTVEREPSGSPRWLIRWSVQGPEKDLEIETHLSPAR